MKRTRGLATVTMLLGALALTGCGASSPTEQPGGGSDRDDDAATPAAGAQADEAGAATEATVVEPVVTLLDPGEEFLSASPSGAFLLTGTDGSAPDASGPQWCFRSGDAYMTVSCTDALAEHTDLAWSPDETHLAVAQQHHHRPEQFAPREVEVTLTVLDVPAGTAQEVTPQDPQDTGAAALTWAEAGHLLHTWSVDGSTALHMVDLTAADAVSQPVHDLGDASVERLEQTDAGLVALGEFGGSRGIYDLGNGTGEATLLTRVLSDQIVRAVDAEGRWVVQGQDSHDVVPPVVHTASTGEKVQLRGVPGKSVASDFTPSGGLGTLTFLPEDTVALTLLDRDLQVVDEVTFPHPEATSYRYQLSWTDRGATLVNTADDGRQRVSVVDL